MAIKKDLQRLLGENLKAVEFVKPRKEADEVKNLKKLFLIGVGAMELNNQNNIRR